MPNETGDEFLVQLCTSEYNALTNRATYCINLTGTVYTLAVIYLPIVAQVWFTKRDLLKPPMERFLLAWVSGIILQLMAIGWAHLQAEIYRITLYIETNLKYQVPLVSRDIFWRFERFLALEQRQGTASTWWEWIVPLVDFAVLSVIVWVVYTVRNWNWYFRDWLGLFLNVLFFYALCRMAYGGVKLRHQWEAEYKKQAKKST